MGAYWTKKVESELMMLVNVIGTCECITSTRGRKTKSHRGEKNQLECSVTRVIVSVIYFRATTTQNLVPKTMLIHHCSLVSRSAWGCCQSSELVCMFSCVFRSWSSMVSTGQLMLALHDHTPCSPKLDLACFH